MKAHHHPGANLELLKIRCLIKHKMTNAEIVDIYIKNGLLWKCVVMQFLKLRDMYKTQFREDMYHDLIVILLEYDNAKLNNAHDNKHMNALVTRMLLNNIWSNTSRFHTTYIKPRRPPGKLCVNIDDVEKEEDYDEDDEG